MAEHQLDEEFEEDAEAEEAPVEDDRSFWRFISDTIAAEPEQQDESVIEEQQEDDIEPLQEEASVMPVSNEAATEQAPVDLPIQSPAELFSETKLAPLLSQRMSYRQRRLSEAIVAVEPVVAVQPVTVEPVVQLPMTPSVYSPSPSPSPVVSPLPAVRVPSPPVVKAPQSPRISVPLSRAVEVAVAAPPPVNPLRNPFPVERRPKDKWHWRLYLRKPAPPPVQPPQTIPPCRNTLLSVQRGERILPRLPNDERGSVPVPGSVGVTALRTQHRVFKGMRSSYRLGFRV